ATLMYLRPASAAAVTAAFICMSPRSRASFTSIGRFIPAMTSAPTVFITEIARLEGVPPNMSVRITTPEPSSARLTASMMSSRRASMSSSGPMQTVSTRSCGPTTCSSADLNSMASAPCVTRTMPIIQPSLEWIAPCDARRVLPLRSHGSRSFFGAAVWHGHRTHGFTHEDQLVEAVHLAGARYRATRHLHAFKAGDQRIFFDHALHLVDEIDHEMQRRLAHEWPAHN